MEWGLRHAELEFDELGLDEDFRCFFVSCVEWLEAEGVVRYKGITVFQDGRATVYKPTISARGMLLLGKSLKVDGKDMTLAAAVRRTTKETAFYTGIGDLGGGFVGGLLKSLGNG